MDVEMVLLKDVAKVGRRGEVVKVSAGYARNFLLPRGLATAPTIRNRTALAAQAQRLVGKRNRLLEEARVTAEKLKNISLVFSKNANDNGDLYGGLQTAEVVTALAENGFQVDKKHVIFDGPINRIGVYNALVRLAEGVEVAVPVTIVRPEG